MPGEVQLRALTKRYDDFLAVDAIAATINRRVSSSRCSGRRGAARRRRCG